MLNVMCASRMVPKPNCIRSVRKSSMKDTPVTMSAFSIGMLVTPMSAVRYFFFIFDMQMTAIVPRTTEITELSSARRIVVVKASPMAASVKSERYQSRVKPPQ